MNTNTKRLLIGFGVSLFLLGLLGGFALPLMANPRMGLSSHLEGVLNGIFLMVLALLGAHISLSDTLQKVLLLFAVYGTYCNWLLTFLAGFMGVGASMMPIAGGEHTGTQIQETLVGFGLISLSISIIAVCAIVLWGLKRGASRHRENALSAAAAL